MVMKTPAYKIACMNNPEAILVSMLIEESHGIVCDCRESKDLVYSKEALDLEGWDKDDLQKAIDDAAMIGELDRDLGIEEIEFDFDEIAEGE
jgi:hypothetical protein